MPKELWKGNEAIAEAAVRAGLQAYFGYPITPQTEILEYLSRRMPELGRAFVQAESELGAINMVYGALTGIIVGTVLETRVGRNDFPPTANERNAIPLHEKEEK